MGNQPSYTDNGDGTISDDITGLMWQQFMGTKINYLDAITKADTLTLGGHSDWRIPTLKEIYSLILFTGESLGEEAIYMYIDTNYFNQPIGDVTIGEREIDAQTWTSTEYVGETMMGVETIFGVNFVDGRIKGYPKFNPPQFSQLNQMYFRMVRGNIDYGTNDFVGNNDGTISDLNTGLMWQQADDGNFYDWENALNFAENLELGGHDDWRLPNPKELHSIVDYSRSPNITNSPAIDPIFYTTEILDPYGNPNQYPYFWTGTTHINSPNPYSTSAYIAFGEAQGIINNQLMDVHGAGAQRSDYKTGNPDDYPSSMGPQGDICYTKTFIVLEPTPHEATPRKIVVNDGSTILDMGTGEHEGNPHYCDAMEELYANIEYESGDTDIAVFKDGVTTFLPEPINLPENLDLQPFLTDDCQTMYFTSSRGSVISNFPLQIYKSQRLGEFEWSEPELFISYPQPEGMFGGVGEFSMTRDEKQMVFLELTITLEGDEYVGTNEMYYAEKYKR